MSIFIDTQLWIFALKIPERSNFKDSADYEKILLYHERSNDFLNKHLAESDILMTFYQLGEIYHVLGFKGNRLPIEFVNEYCSQLLNGEYMHWYPIDNNIIIESMKLSCQSGIHIWDYLCVLPLYKDVEVVYTCDKHFKHESFQSLGPPIENPLDEWIIL